MYNFGEKLYSYENIREGAPQLNEDARRRQIAKPVHQGSLSGASLSSSPLFGVGALWLYSRPGAKSMFDFGACRKNIWFSFAVFSGGMILGQMVGLSNEKFKQGGQ